MITKLSPIAALVQRRRIIIITHYNKHRLRKVNQTLAGLMFGTRKS